MHSRQLIWKTDPIFLSNRSLCLLCLGQPERALADAKACRALKPDWPKACFREGAALRLMQKFDEAAKCFYEGQLDPKNKELADAFKEAVDAGMQIKNQLQIKEEVMSMQCKVCVQKFMSISECMEHAEAKHPESDVDACFPDLKP
ncbi:hypothetical protein ACLB2K_046778 [Fragaria x ananassa]